MQSNAIGVFSQERKIEADMASWPELVDLLGIARTMAVSIPVKDRSYHLRSYKNCFLGSDAVMFLVGTSVAPDATTAIEIGNKMISAGLFSHVCNEHMLENEDLFYRFSDLVTSNADQPLPAPAIVEPPPRRTPPNRPPPTRTPPSRPPLARPTPPSGELSSALDLLSVSRSSSQPSSQASSQPASQPSSQRSSMVAPITDDEAKQFPVVLRRCLEYLASPRALADEGIFRTSGSKNVIDALDRRFRDGEDVDLSDQLDPPVVASLFKIYLARTLQPPFSSKDAKALCEIATSDPTTRVERARAVIAAMSPLHASMTRGIFRMLRQVVESPATKMTSSGLGSMIAPSLFRNMGSVGGQPGVTFLVDNVDHIWPDPS
eukprot:m.235076 g.235076  ORF g.235076 m.235076 type:complete len:376 (-) comp12760_c0_seq1:145-1272(-)